MPRATRPETVTLRNLGDGTVANPRIVVNGRRDWFDIDSILAGILEPGMSKRDKALTIWQFVVDNRRHDQPVHHHVEAHDPARFFNVYGYGFCDDAATNFMVLAERARLSSRVWTLGGHVVAEARYDGSWHMFDADAEVYYLDQDGQTIAGVEQLAENPDLIRRRPSPVPEFPVEDLVRIYSSREDNRVAGWYRVNSGADHTMAFTLRPGESVMRSRGNWGHYVASRAGTEPASYSNGRFTFVPVLRDSIFRQGALGAAGVDDVDTGRGPRLVFDADDEAYVTYPFNSPYPILSARVRITGELYGDGDAWLDYTEDGRRRVNLWTASDAGRIDVEIPLDSQLRKDSGRPVYNFFLTVGHSARAAGAEWQIERLRFETDFQHAPRALPEFEEGDNKIRYIDGGSDGPRKIEVIFD